MTESTSVALPDELLNPMTGELVRTADLNKVATTIYDLRAFQRQVRDTIGAFTDVLVEESRRLGKRTLVAGGMDVEISAPDELDWDMEILEELRDAGLPESRWDELVVATITYKVSAKTANQLSSGNPAYKAIIDRARRRNPKAQYVSFK